MLGGQYALLGPPARRATRATRLAAGRSPRWTPSFRPTARRSPTGAAATAHPWSWSTGPRPPAPAAPRLRDAFHRLRARPPRARRQRRCPRLRPRAGVRCVTAIGDAIGAPVNLLGHSYGALCALEAMRLTRNIRQLVLCEPTTIARLEALLARRRGPNAGTARVAGAGRGRAHHPARAARLRQLPLRSGTIPGYPRADAAPAGDVSPASLRVAVEAVAAALPDARLVDMPGQGHAAIDTGPALFTAAVLRFLTAAED